MFWCVVYFLEIDMYLTTQSGLKTPFGEGWGEFRNSLSEAISLGKPNLLNFFVY